MHCFRKTIKDLYTHLLLLVLKYNVYANIQPSQQILSPSVFMADHLDGAGVNTAKQIIHQRKGKVLFSYSSSSKGNLGKPVLQTEKTTPLLQAQDLDKEHCLIFKCRGYEGWCRPAAARVMIMFCFIVL